METLHHTGVFRKEPVERVIKGFARNLCDALSERTCVTMQDDGADLVMTILTGEVIVSIHVAEGRMKI